MDFHFEINGEEWLVRFSKRMRGKAMGWCDYSLKKILVDDRLPREVKLDVLIHEVVHAIHRNLSEESVTYTGSKIAEIVSEVFSVEENQHVPADDVPWDLPDPEVPPEG